MLSRQLAAEGNLFEDLHEKLSTKNRVSWESLSGLGAAIEEAVGGSKRKQTRSSVSLTQLFDGIVQYRNAERGHSGMRPAEFRAQMANALAAGAVELLEQVDILAGGTLIYLSEIRQVPTSGWQLQAFELVGTSARRLTPWIVPTEFANELPLAESLYLLTNASVLDRDSNSRVWIDDLKAALSARNV